MCDRGRAAKQPYRNMNEEYTTQLAAESNLSPEHLEHAAQSEQPSVSPDSQGFVRQMDAATNKMMDAMHAPSYTGNSDVDFLAMMIAHHQGPSIWHV